MMTELQTVPAPQIRKMPWWGQLLRRAFSRLVDLHDKGLARLTSPNYHLRGPRARAWSDGVDKILEALPPSWFVQGDCPCPGCGTWLPDGYGCHKCGLEHVSAARGPGEAVEVIYRRCPDCGGPEFVGRPCEFCTTLELKVVA